MKIFKSTLAVMLMSVLFLGFISCEKETNQDENLDYSYKKDQDEEYYETKYCNPDKSFKDCGSPESHECIRNYACEIIYLESKVAPVTPIGELFELIDKQAETEKVLDHIKIHYDLMFVEFGEKRINQVLQNELFLKHTFNEDVHGLLFKTSLKESDKEALEFVKLFHLKK